MSLIAILRVLENGCNFSSPLRTEEFPGLLSVISEEAETFFKWRVGRCLFVQF